MSSFKHSKKLEIFIPDLSGQAEYPLVGANISAGFPSPAEDYEESKLDLNHELIRNPSSTFFARVYGDSMIDSGIHNGDLLIVDRSLKPREDSVLVCFVDGEFTLKRIRKIDTDTLFLMPDNPQFEPIRIPREGDFRVWGVVTYNIHKHYA